MTAGSLVALTIIYFAISMITVVTGSTTLLTIPVMLQFGIEPRTAVATNMLALTWLSFGGALPFLRTTAIDRPRVPVLTALTLAGSAAGALLLFTVPAKKSALLTSSWHFPTKLTRIGEITFPLQTSPTKDHLPHGFDHLQ